MSWGDSFFLFSLLDLPDPDQQLPHRDQPKYSCFKGEENHSLFLLIFFCLKPSILAVFDILYKGEVCLAPLQLRRKPVFSFKINISRVF
jgi:hypothetical protein